MDCIENIKKVFNLIKKGGYKNTFKNYYIYNGTKNVKLIIKIDS